MMRRSIIVALSTLLAYSAAACGDDDASGTNSEHPIEYPRVTASYDIATPIEGIYRDAAEFAGKIFGLKIQLEYDSPIGATYPRPTANVTYRDKEIIDEYNQQVDSKRKLYYTGPAKPVGTGGETLRVVDSRALEESGHFRVAICEYKTPGIYVVEDSGKRLDPKFGEPADHDYYLSYINVRLTDNVADGNSAPPRWIYTDRGPFGNVSDEDRLRICEPHKPEPFIQKPPNSISQR